MGGVVHLVIAPRAVLTEVGQRRVDQRPVARDGPVVEAVRTQRSRRRAFEEDVSPGQQLPEEVLRRLAADVEGDALLAGVVPPVVEAAVGIDLVVDEGAAPPSRTATGRLDLDHPRAAVGQELARPLVAAIGEFDHGEALVHPAHVRLSPLCAPIPLARRPTLFQVSTRRRLFSSTASGHMSTPWRGTDPRREQQHGASECCDPARESARCASSSGNAPVGVARVRPKSPMRTRTRGCGTQSVSLVSSGRTGSNRRRPASEVS